MSHILGGDTYKSIYPHWDGDRQELIKKCHNRIKDIYGNNPPEWILDRLNDELTMIGENDFSAYYLMMQDVVDKTYLKAHEFFVRGTAGNSFVSYLLGITGEINPLPAHYRCIGGHYCEKATDKSIKFGCELPDKVCPVCGRNLKKDGFSLHHYMFMTDKGDRCPDFELNVPKRFTQEPLEWMGNLKGIAAAVPVINSSLSKDGFTKEITGYILVPDHVMDNPGIKEFLHKYRGKTITGREYYEKYRELPKINIINQPYCDMLVEMAAEKGVDVTKISLSDIKVKDMLKHLNDIPVSEAKRLFDPCSAKEEEGGEPPYFITIMKETGAGCFYDVVKAYGLMHGKGVYLGNAKELMDGGVTDISGVICDRDDIMWNCIEHGIDETTAYRIADSIRRGKGLDFGHEEVMLSSGIPQWYIDSCNRIRYLFPKAHGISYALQIWRLMYLMEESGRGIDNNE